MAASASVAADHAAVRARRLFMRRAAQISASTKRTPSHTGGGGMRQSGSHRIWKLTAERDNASSQAQSEASHAEFNAMARKPSGTTALRTGTTRALAESPEAESRWK